MFRLLSMFTLCFSACSTANRPELVFATQAVPSRAELVHCDSATAFAEVIHRHHFTLAEIRDLGDDASKAADVMSSHPGLLNDILSIARCDTTTPSRDVAFFEQMGATYAAVFAASAAPTVDAGRALWLLGEHLRAGSLMHMTVGASIQEDALRRVIAPALAALPPEAREAAVADLHRPLDVVALADDEQALADQLPLPMPSLSTLSAWVDDMRCRVALPGLLDDLRGLDALPPAERTAAWAAQHEDHAVCTDYDKPIAKALDRDVRLLRGLEGV